MKNAKVAGCLMADEAETPGTNKKKNQQQKGLLTVVLPALQHHPLISSVDLLFYLPQSFCYHCPEFLFFLFVLFFVSRNIH